MKLTNFIKKYINKYKTHQLKTEYSYKFLEYCSQDGNIFETVWNGTNLVPPNYIIDKSNRFKLFLINHSTKTVPKYSPKKGERYFSYKSPNKYVQERSNMLKFFWEHNFDECQKVYSSYEEYFAIACKSMDKPRLELIIA